MRLHWWVPALLLLLVGARGLGLLSVGLVTTGSMAPALPPGTVFVAVPGEPQVGDVVVFQLPDGVEAVHRVVDRTPEGLVTQGDANPRTDQEAGMPPVPPDEVRVVPHVAGAPLALQGPLVRPVAVLAVQAGLVAVAVRGLTRNRVLATAGWPLRALRPHHLLVVAGLLLLSTGPMLHDRVEAGGAVEVQGLAVPTVARVTAGDEVHTFLLPPLGTREVPVEEPGAVDVVRSPALPGAATLARHGGTWAVLPSSLTVWAGAAILRREGR